MEKSSFELDIEELADKVIFLSFIAMASKGCRLE